ncbi:MAG: hypothetical protein HC887_10700 [Desulfobacteraceae bacterium]|nr:hypothetical protein [Desulfobacteraceae bacterium]
MEAAYDMNEKQNFDKAFSVEFGISIPIVNPNRLDMNRRTLNALKAVSDYADLKGRLRKNHDSFKRHQTADQPVRGAA